jgi:hypothetical protein
MNRSNLKTYAPKARLDFIRAVTDRAAVFGLTSDRVEPMRETGDVVIIGGRPFPKVVASQRRLLEERIRRMGFNQAVEAMAYIWFNRFVALRYMELHGYLDHGYRVLSHPEGKATPEIVEHAEHVTLPGLGTKEVIELKLDGAREAELYRLLLVAQCNALHEAMPFLFEKIADETELLLPDNLLHSDSVIRKLVNEIEEADWQQVEIIGWLYQFYISDKKAEVIGKVVKSEDIPAATQLFTPNWIVKYLVQNTLGRQWLATYPDSPIRQQMEYYIEPAAQTDDVQAQLAAITPRTLDPETLSLLDPASGSGHILVEAYDLFKAIYQERGYRSKDIPRLILEKNLFGLEIDDRAAQLAAFALLMKARADDRRIFADHVQPNVIAIQESKGLENLLRPDPAPAKGAGELPFADSDLFPQTDKQLTLTKPNQESPLAAVEPCLRELINLFEHGKTFGSLIRVPPKLTAQLPAARQSIEAMVAKGQLWEHRAAALLLPLVNQAEFLAKNYNAVVSNPPYMGNGAFNSDLKSFMVSNYKGAERDLFSAFIHRNALFGMPYARLGFMTSFVWMFISSFEILRRRVVGNHTITSLVQLHYDAFTEAKAHVCCYVLDKQHFPLYRGTYVRLVDFPGEEAQGQKTLEAIRNPTCGWAHFAKQSDFPKLPSCPIAYWESENILAMFGRDEIGNHTISDGQTKTGNNERFIRHTWEVSSLDVGSSKKWRLHTMGGYFRPWYGNVDSVIDWSEKARTHYRKDHVARILPDYLWNREGICWNLITSNDVSFRVKSSEEIFNLSAPTLFPKEEKHLLLFLAFTNTTITKRLLTLINPTVNTNVQEIQHLPLCKEFFSLAENVTPLARECVEIAKQDWNSKETSVDFQGLAWVGYKAAFTMEQSWLIWETHTRDQVRRIKELEEENNRVFIQAYGLDGDVHPAVEDRAIVLIRAERKQDSKQLLSYGIGCMMGRYSMDKPGLVYAHSRNEGFDASQYQTFPADADGIIPITELAWFPDDATERFVEFIGKAWPPEHLEENLKFVADSLGANRDEHPRSAIRRYLSQNFYKDHLRTYKRRPIYWLFCSGRQKAFQCLVYLHRYHEGTLAQMRTEYVIPLQGKLSQRMEQLAGDITAATSTSHRRKLEKERDTLLKQRTELAAFDEKLRHYADQRIALDLDDGVKVNYAKFGDLLAEVKAVTGGKEE